MAWYDGLWQVLAAALTAAAALWQFAGLKDTQKAAELLHLEQAISSAAARKDPIEHGYRAHLLQRMQALHGNRSSSAFFAGLWGFSAFMFLLMLLVSRGGTLWAQLIIFGGLYGSTLFAFRNLAKYLYSSRTLDLETGQAYEVAMVAARQSLVDSSKNLPPLQPQPQLVKKAVAAWKATARDKKVDLAWFVGLIGVVVVLGMFGYHAREEGWIEWREAIAWSSWLAAVCLALLPIGSSTLRKVTTRFQPPKLGLSLYWLIQAAWVVLVLRFGPERFENLVYDTIESDRAMSYKEFFTMLASLAGSGLLLLWMAVAVRYRRWRRARMTTPAMV